ncbi:MAG: ATP-dependent DNA helicase [Methanosarcinales archaeon]|nr:ATP-dependent DNA helicase [Methanosarcinales archaeon]
MTLPELLLGLKDKQLDAVKHTTGPLLILAGAGTGKTTTITAKIAYMVQEMGIEPAQILALTFSREAAANMNSKVEQLLGGASEVHVSTFHSFCAEIIRENADKCGVPAEFAILDDVDTAIIMHTDLKVSIKDALLYTNSISKAKDLNITIDMLKEFLDCKKQRLLAIVHDETSWDQTYSRNTTRLNTFHLLDKEEQKVRTGEKKTWIAFNELYAEYARYRDLIRTWVRYESRKAKRGALDYGDLNKKAMEFLNIYGAQQVNERYRYIIIDEFQDTNYVQFELIRMLAGNEHNVTVVADPNQTIYAFRGAYTNNIQEFMKYFTILPGDVLSLDVSFRSTDKILRVSHKLIKLNYSQNTMDLCIQLHNHAGVDGDDVRIVETADENEEARYVVEQIEACLDNGMTPSDIAVLYRTHAQGRKVKRALESRGHSIRVKDDTDFMKQAEIKTALAYLYVLDNIVRPRARGTESWWRLFHHNHALGTADSIRIGEYLKKHRVSFQEAIYHHLNALDLSPRGLKVVRQMKQRIGALKEKLILDVSDIVLEVLDASGLSRQFTLENTRQNREAMMNLRNLYEMAVKFETSHGRDLSEFIAYLEILDEMGKNPSASRISEDNAVNLMSIHSSKGLEFKAVFVINMAKDRFPLFKGGVEPLIPLEMMEHYRDLLQQDFSSDNQRSKALSERKREIKLEEERRLCYVAMTRARQQLTLTLAGQYDGRERQPSEFIQDLGYDNWRAQDTPVIEIPDITYIHDTDISSEDMITNNELERTKAQRKKLILETLDSGSFEENLGHVLTYHALRDNNETDYREVIHNKWDELNPAGHVHEILERCRNNEGLPVPPSLTFSVTSVNTYSKCPKMYELKQVLGMPTRAEERSDGAMNVGSFVHRVLEMAVRQKISTREQLDSIVISLTQQDTWKWVDRELARPLLEVFWKRNKYTIPNNLMVEKMFSVQLDKHIFTGFIDRVDLVPGSDNAVEIIDYKTGKEPDPVERSRQLLLYAEGFRHLYPEYSVRKLTLELLSQQKPRVYELQDGEYVSSRVQPLDKGVIPEMVDVANRIIHDHKYGFSRCDDDKQCKKCGYKLYCDYDAGKTSRTSIS